MFNVLKPGDLVQAEFIGYDRRGAFFNLPPTATGIVYGRELLNAREIIKGLNPGDIITAKIVEVDSEIGYTELSLLEADKQKVWQEFKELKDKGEVLTVTISGANSGGLMADIQKVKAFLPVSQLSNQHYPRVSENDKEQILAELKKFEGAEMQVKVITVNQKSAKLIISEREITDKNVQEMLRNYQAGDAVHGTISGVADFGAFIRFDEAPEIEGLIHISELDHRLVDNPKEIVAVNDKVTAIITEIKDGRVSLSLKATKPDPWKNLPSKFAEGQEVRGQAFKYNPFGAFVNVEGSNVQGLIHVSEFGSVEEMKEMLPLNTERDFMIETLKPDEKRLILKLKK